jgi:hypothetical protein
VCGDVQVPVMPLKRLSFLLALAICAAAVAAATLYVRGRSAGEAAMPEPAGQTQGETPGDPDYEGCSACDARHQRLQQNRRGEE